MFMEERSKEKIITFFKSYKKKEYRTKERIINADESINSIYFLEKGLVKQYTITREGEEITLHIFKPFSYFPIMLVLSNNPNSYFFEAVQDTTVYVAPTKDVLEFINTNDDVLKDLTVRLSMGIVGLLKKIENIISEQAYSRVISTLLYLGKSIGKKEEKDTSVSLIMSHADIASWVGLQRETVSRQLERLHKKGIVQNQNHILSLDITKLTEELEAVTV